MSLDIWECLKLNTFTCALNTDQIPGNKDNYRKADLYIYIEERDRDLIVGIRFLDYVTVFTHI